MPDVLSLLLGQDAGLHRIIDDPSGIGGTHTVHLSEGVGIVQREDDLLRSHPFFQQLEGVGVVHEGVEIEILVPQRFARILQAFENIRSSVEALDAPSVISDAEHAAMGEARAYVGVLVGDVAQGIDVDSVRTLGHHPDEVKAPVLVLEGDHLVAVVGVDLDSQSVLVGELIDGIHIGLGHGEPLPFSVQEVGGQAEEAKAQFVHAAVDLPERLIHIEGLYYEATGELVGVLALDGGVVIVLEADRIRAVLFLPTVAVELGQAEHNPVIDLEALHPFQLLLEEKARGGDRAGPIALLHEALVVIDPEELLLPHEAGDLRRLREDMSVSVDAHGLRGSI